MVTLRETLSGFEMMATAHSNQRKLSIRNKTEVTEFWLSKILLPHIPGSQV